MSRWTALVFVLAACAPAPMPPPQGDAGLADAGSDDPDPSFTLDELTALRALRYDEAPPPPDVSNRVADDAAARSFGHRLFFDPSFSGPLLEADNDGAPGSLGRRGEAGKVSCASCHVPLDGFVDTRSRHQQISLAALWTKRRTPTLLEAGFSTLFNWDGRRESLWTQAIGVMESEHEFNSGRLFVAEQIFRNHRAEYEAIFGALPALDDAQRFPQLSPLQTGCVARVIPMGVTYDCAGRPGDGAAYDGLAVADQRAVTQVMVNVTKALAAYMRRLRCGEGRFDAWLDGDASALTREEQRGAALFVGKGKCVSCHSGPNLTDFQFHNVGLQPQVVAVAFVDSNDRGAGEGLAGAVTDPLNVQGAFSDGNDGRLPATVSATMEGAFKTPTLRCSSKRPSFMHTGHLRTLEQVVSFFSKGGDRQGYPGASELTALSLSPRERADLVAFMKTLDGPGPAAALLLAP